MDFKPPSLTEDELKMIKECNREGFWKRCVPFSALSLSLLFMAQSNGYIPKSHMGIKSFTVGVAAYILGKIAYTPICREKILMTLPPDSRLVAMAKGNFNEVSEKKTEFDGNSPSSLPSSSSSLDDHVKSQYDLLREVNRGESERSPSRILDKSTNQTTFLNEVDKSKRFDTTTTTTKRYNKYGDEIYENDK
ncbi:hypothetical protein SNEBB_007696 [Seison nebaliae]|nr:hypothetical protein SNEBB_007696 [Seison nebaliae]